VDPVARFAELAALPEEELELGEAALAIAGGGDPELDVARWLAELDGLAAGLAGLDELTHRLFRELGFQGNRANYYDPQNSFLHRVIERRVGIPISLSVLTIEVGRRAGIELEGVGMPGHFLVHVPSAGTYLDPFNGVEGLDEHGCEALFREVVGAGPEVPFGPHLLATAGKHEILARMLINLRTIYRGQGSGRDLEWTVRMALALPGAPPELVLELGEALEMQGKLLEAARELEERSERYPRLSEVLRTTAQGLRARLN
jgi:regulator of sirC expression with transglutaminase-like and TPR domain